MRDNLFFLGLLSAHFVGDYYLQTSLMAKMKKGNFSMTLKHTIYYSAPFLFLPFLFKESLGWVLLAIAVHFVVDFIKFQLEKHKNIGKINRVLKPDHLYLIDQTIHILSLFLMARVAFLPLRTSPFFAEVNLELLLRLLPGFLFLFKPANVTFKIIFGRFSPVEKDLVSIRGAGAVIGSLERILMFIFLGLSQFAAVGLIMTAKSIARYDKISKDPVFAEYYLIGTLYSILVTVISYVLFLL